MTAKSLGAAAVVLLLGASAYGAFFLAPTEATMGIVQRIFYLHAPCGMTALAAFIVCFVGNLGFLFKREAKWEWLSVSAAEVGLAALGDALAAGLGFVSPARIAAGGFDVVGLGSGDIILFDGAVSLSAGRALSALGD